MRSELFLQTPSWFILICLIVGALYAFALYQAHAPWDKKINYLLAGLRGVMVSLICFLLLAPLIRNTKTQIEKAKIVFAIDNSQSVQAFSKNAIAALKSAASGLQNAGYDVIFQTADQAEIAPDSIQFKNSKTDLSKLLQQVTTGFEGLHVTDVVLVSDGIVNQGILPTYTQYPFKINTLALGDTIPKVDVGIRDVVYNRIAYLGNDFPIKAEILAHDLKGKTTQVHLKQGGKIIGSQRVNIDEGSFFKVFEFKASSKSKGVQHYTVEIEGVAGETNLHNNRKEVYVDIIDGRQKILLLAYAPHPDLKAYKRILEGNDNYELDTWITSVSDNPASVLNKPYDLIITHQIPNQAGKGTEILNKFIESKTPIFYSLGGQSAVGVVNKFNQTVQIQNSKGQTDQVGAQYNTGFQQLSFVSDEMKLLDRLPPLSVPFGEYIINSGAESLLFQRIGKLNTTKPLLALNTSGEVKSGILAGEGIWHWRQEEYALVGNNFVTDQLFQKVIQLLSVRSDKRKFRVYPIRSEFEVGESVVFQTEIYNNVYEQIYGNEIALELTDEHGKKYNYTYVHTEEQTQFIISGLQAGVFQYKAISGKESVSGQLVVREVDTELSNLTANFGMLRSLSDKSGGIFSTSATFENVVNKLIQNPAKSRLSSSEEMVDLIDLKWIFALILAMLTMEWGLRKYHGGY